MSVVKAASVLARIDDASITIVIELNAVEEAQFGQQTRRTHLEPTLIDESNVDVCVTGLTMRQFSGNQKTRFSGQHVQVTQSL